MAGAGTGKTMTLAHRVAHLIASGADPGRILLLTFTRRAAAEMLRRVDGILRRLRSDSSASAAIASGKVWGGTFHAIAARLLRLHGRSIGLDPAFTILDRSDSEDLLNVVRTELGLAKTTERFPQKSTCMGIYGRCVDSRRSLQEILDDAFPWCKDHADDLKRLFLGYVDRKTEHAVLDYDDLLLFWHGLLTDPVAGAKVRDRFDCVLVDEYQDTNILQAEILSLLRPGGAGLTVVGDDAQSIYSFRAATVRNILDFPEQFPRTTVVTLEQNYRSTQPILDATNSVIAQAIERHTKNLWSERASDQRPVLITCEDEGEQTEFLVQQILEHREGGLPLHRQAVLFRASHHSLALELELARRNIPFHKYGGLKFCETAHVKDLTAFLRLAENPRDLIAGTRVLLLIPGIGPKTAEQLMKKLIAGGGDFDGWADDRPSGAAAELWSGFASLMAVLASAGNSGLASQIHQVRTFYEPLLARAYEDADLRMGDLEQLQHLAGRSGDRARFLAEIAIDPPAWTGDLAGPPVLDEDYLILSTMHSAKGLEWDTVYVIHAADGNIPSDMACGRPEEIEEELRLFYVALTRAKDWLYVCFPLRYYKRPRDALDTYGYAQLTRFMQGGAQSLFDQRAALPGRRSQEPNSEAAAVSSQSIRDRTRQIWL